MAEIDKAERTASRTAIHNVDDFVANAKRWRGELDKLRAILLDSELIEEFKWYQPCYTFQGKNVAILHGLKESCALGFFKGALMKDVHGVLTAPGQNTQAGRWIKFTSVREIAEMKSVLKAYVREAIEVEKKGLKLKMRKTSDLKIPEEFQIMLDEFPELEDGFRCIDAGTATSLHLSFFRPQTIQNPGVAGSEIYAAYSQGKGPSR